MRQSNLLYVCVVFTMLSSALLCARPNVLSVVVLCMFTKMPDVHFAVKLCVIDQSVSGDDKLCTCKNPRLHAGFDLHLVPYTRFKWMFVFH